MTDQYFPPLTLENLLPLRVIAQGIEDDPDYLSKSEYDDETKDLLSGWFSGISIETIEQVSVGEIDEEASELYASLKKFSDKLKDGDTSEWMTFFRVSTSLLEKILTLQERATNVKMVRDFEAKVMAVFDDVLNADQRTVAMEMLKDEGK